MYVCVCVCVCARVCVCVCESVYAVGRKHFFCSLKFQSVGGWIYCTTLQVFCPMS